VNTESVTDKPAEEKLPMPQMAFVACLSCGDPLASSTDRAAGRCSVCLANATAARAMLARAFGGGR
jgi:hypothetical protein